MRGSVCRRRKVQAMETKTRQDTMGCQSRGHIRPLTLPALESDVTLLAPAAASQKKKIRRPLISTTFGAVTNGDSHVAVITPVLYSWKKGLVSIDGDGHGLLTQSRHQSQLALCGTDNVTVTETHSATAH